MTTTTWLPCLLLILAITGTHGIHDLDYNQFLREQLPATCPYTQFCTTGPPKPFSNQKYTPCCRQCSCQPDCVKNERCCHDYPGLDNITEAPIACSLPAIEIHKIFDKVLTGLSYGIKLYRIIQNCPPGYVNKTVVESCIHPNISNLGENRIVSDVNGRVFQNGNCAKCNDAQRIVNWNINILCRSYVHEHVLPNSWSGVLAIENCIALFVPPDTATLTSVSSSQCLKPQVSTCNFTGEWKQYDVNLERACNMPATSNYYINEIPFLGFNQIYKNVFCFLCDIGLHKRLNDRQDVCMNPEEDFPQKSGVNPFTIFLNTVPIESAGKTHGVSTNDLTSPTVCLSSEIYDTHFDKCRVLTCPIPLMPFDGKCVDIYAGINGLTVRFQIKMQHENISQIVTSKEDMLSLGVTSYNHINEQFRFQNKGCRKCATELFYNVESVIIVFGFITTDSCQPAVLISKLHEWQNERQTITLTDTTFELKVTYMDVSRLKSTFAATIRRSDAFCQRQSTLHELFYCPSIDIEAEEYNLLALQHSEEIDVDAFTMIQTDTTYPTNTTYRICVERYLPSPRSNTAPSEQVFGILVHSCLVLVFNLLI